MRTRAFRLTEEQANELQSAYLQCRDADTKTRYQAVRLYGLGYAVAQIKDICGCSTTSLMEWCRVYREQDLSALADHRLGGVTAQPSVGTLLASNRKSLVGLVSYKNIC